MTARAAAVIAGIAGIAVLAAAEPAAAQTEPAAARETKRFFDPARRWHMDLPASWRLLAPLEALKLAERPGIPKQLHFVEPGLFMVIGPVDRWLAGDFGGVWLFVVVSDDEWVTDEHFAANLEGMWRAIGAKEGVEHRVTEVRREKVGTEGYDAITSLRTSAPTAGGTTRSLDLHVPSGGKQLSFSFTCLAEDFTEHEAEFRRMGATLTLAKRSRGQATWSDRLWTPLLVGSLVGIALVVLYRRTRQGRAPS